MKVHTKPCCLSLLDKMLLKMTHDETLLPVSVTTDTTFDTIRSIYESTINASITGFTAENMWISDDTSWQALLALELDSVVVDVKSPGVVSSIEDHRYKNFVEFGSCVCDHSQYKFRNLSVCFIKYGSKSTKSMIPLQDPSLCSFVV